MSSKFAQGSYEPLTHFPPRERKNSSIPIKSRKKLLKSLGICGFLFLLFCLLHTRNWLQFGSHVIPRLSRFSPQKIPFSHFFATKRCFYPENSTIFAQFLWFFRDLKDFCGLFSLSGGIRVAYLIVFFIYFIILYIIYFTYFSPIYFTFPTIYENKKPISPQFFDFAPKNLISSKSRNFLLKNNLN